jgi:hypothetical protein
MVDKNCSDLPKLKKTKRQILLFLWGDGDQSPNIEDCFALKKKIKELIKQGR